MHKKIKIYNKKTGNTVINDMCNKIKIHRMFDSISCPLVGAYCKNCDCQRTFAVEIAQILYDGGGLASTDSDTIKVGNDIIKLHERIMH